MRRGSWSPVPTLAAIAIVPVLGIAILAGCEGCGNDAESSGAAATGSGGAASGGGEGASEQGTGGQEGTEATVDPGPAPTLSLAVTPGDDGAQALVVENRGVEEVSLRSALVLEAQRGDDFATVDGVAGLKLRYDCETEPPECVTLVPGAALHPPPWTGDLGDAQCICTRCADAPAGTYRFVVTSCSGAHRVASPAFER